MEENKVVEDLLREILKELKELRQVYLNNISTGYKKIEYIKQLAEKRKKRD